MFELTKQLETLEELREYRQEYDHLPRTQASAAPKAFFLKNGMFGSVDAEMLWAMIRWIEPSRIVEIGSGWTTALMSQAVGRNGVDCAITTIDPVPPGPAYNRKYVTLHAKRLEDVSGALDGLTEDDMIIVDSTHKFTTDGEIDLVLRALPELSGVYVMFHDIFLPYGYPPQWTTRGYDEQDFLSEYLEEHPKDEVLLAANFLHQDHPEELEKSFASYDPGRPIGPGALWFRTSEKKAATTTRKATQKELETEDDEPETEVADSESMAALL